MSLDGRSRYSKQCCDILVKIGSNLPSLSSRAVALRNEIWLLGTIIHWMPETSFLYIHKYSSDIFGRFYSMEKRILDIDFDFLPHESYMSRWIEEHMKTVAELKPALKKLNALQIKIKYKKFCGVFLSERIDVYIDDVVKVQEHLLTSNKQAIVAVQNLRSYQDLSKLILKWCSHEGTLLEKLRVHLRSAANHTTTFFYLSHVEPETNHDILFTDLLQMTKLMNSEVNRTTLQALASLYPSDYILLWLDESAVGSFIDYILVNLEVLSHYQGSFVIPVKNQLEILHEHISSLKNMVPVEYMESYPPKEYMLGRARTIQELVIKFVKKIGSFSFKDTDDDARNRELLRDLKEMINTRAELGKSPSNDFPVVRELNSINNFLESLNDMMLVRPDVIDPIKQQVDFAFTLLQNLSNLLYKTKGMHTDEQGGNVVWRRFFHVLYKAEFVIQSRIDRYGPAHFQMLQLSTIMEEIQHLGREVLSYVKKVHDTIPTSYSPAENTFTQVPLEGSNPDMTDIVVGFKHDFETVMRHLVEASNERNIVAIVGMPGLGKTYLAKKVYNDPYIRKHFQCRAWCYVSQSYQIKDLFLQILQAVSQITSENMSKKSEGEVAEMVYKALKMRRYFIILDDVWDTDTWNGLRMALPDSRNGSRIMITSRMHHVALSIQSYIHVLPLFTDEESYELLQHKLFPQGGFPIALSQAGRMIAKNCQGLPLAVVLAAGFLSRMEKIESEWVKFGESLSAHQILSDRENLSQNIVELSYNHLPNHLKSCFLYLAAFPVDEDISAKKLTWLWIAEGFIQGANGESLEDLADEYLMDLIGRSLMVASKNKSTLGVKSCRVHEMLHEFCLVKAREESFMQIIHGYDILHPPDIGGSDIGVDYDVHQEPSKMTYELPRLSIHSKREHFVMAKPRGPNARTLLFHPLSDMYPGHPYNISFISHNFKLIKVLDLGSINIGVSLSVIASLLQLSYLEVQGEIESIPTSIANLWNLKVFVLRGIRAAVISFPNSIYSMLRLRHLHIDDYTSFYLENEEVENSTILTELKSFSTPTFSYGDNVENMLRRCPNLQKLKCVFLDSWDHQKKCNRYPVLEFLSQLISLNVSCNYKPFDSIQRYPCQFSFPNNLRKLTLSEFGLPWSEISSVGKLPNLEVLKLLSRAFVGENWDMTEGEFVNLRYLKVVSLDIEEWSAEDESMPCLESLVLIKCKKLKEIPLIIGEIVTLENIEVQHCSHSAALSAKRILEEQQDNGYDILKVHVYPIE